MKFKTLLVTTAMAGIVTVFSAQAQNAPASDQMQAAPVQMQAAPVASTAPADDGSTTTQSVVQTNDGTVEFVSGGVADSGMQAIDAEQHHYNLKLLFVNKAGEYLADVKVLITDMKGATVIDTRTKGPVLLARIPAGKYKIDTTTTGGETLSRNVTLSDKLSSDTLRYAGGENQ